VDLVVFEQDKPFVLQALGQGEFDYIEAASEVVETEFFRFIKARGILRKLAQSYPSPRKKHDVPLFLYISANLSMRLHGVHAFHAFPMVVRTGGMLHAFGPTAGKKVTDAETGELHVLCEGTNQKNAYPRQSPCDPDYLRKLSKDTDAAALMGWFNTEALKVLHSRRAVDKAGLLIGDASYLFVPDNPNYEGSVRMRFDEHNHPLSKKEYEQLSPQQKERTQWRRCYKMVTLLHTNRQLEFFLFVGVRIISGKAHESPVLYEMVRHCVRTTGKGVFKRLILDRGFIDGESIGAVKQDLGIDVLIPIRRNMDVYDDAMGLFKERSVKWEPYTGAASRSSTPSQSRPESLRKRERARQETNEKIKEQKPPPPPDKALVKTEVAAINGFRSWSSCPVPLTVVANRETFADGHQKTWLLIDTAEHDNPCASRSDYALRTSIEERYRQLKCFAELTHFTSRAFSMVVNQVIFILLAYDLLQFYLFRHARKDLTNKPMPHIRQQLLPSDNHVIVYYRNYYGLFTPMELLGFAVNLPEEPRMKIGQKCRRLCRELNGLALQPRPP